MGSDCQAPEGSVRRCVNVIVVVKAWIRQEKKLFWLGKNLLVMIAGEGCGCIALAVFFVVPSFEIL